jgi:putative spermidine/putrescine transport system substrate-binding protein
MLLVAATGPVAAGLTACGGDGNGSSPTHTPEPTETPKPEPSPTQGLIASPVAGYTDPAKWEGRTLTFAGWGGDYQDAQEEAFLTPFGTATGASIQIKRADLGELRSQVEHESVAWDVVLVPMQDVLDLAHGQYLEPIDYQVVDRTSLFADEIALQYGVGAAFSSTVMIYPTGTTNAPQDWNDFWTVGPLTENGEIAPIDGRSLRRSPIGTLEFALLADGVAIPDLYPLDVERAFAALDRIRANVLVWWEERKEPIELIAAQQAGMASAWYAPLWQLEVLDKVSVQWFGGMLDADAWVVPKGAPNADIAMDFINYATRAIPSANFSRLVPYGPVNKDAAALLRDDRLRVLPGSAMNKPVQFVQNWNYWTDNRQALVDRFEEWFLSGPREDTASPESE